ncbi:type I methionyl aminopeptidase [Coprobacillus sp. AF33-1AC]|uniref:type I methionyl aminopeptidase n=1 Tax=Coprobacillus sp. AF33-1AC TaxID=2292032 RepID=UPI000E47684E|nr:type I methionyl aminopeptidase [Coprobacillus sp. AF33-1AC]RHM60028.1 type I methionyl aminopeptidase [Coprobacillus sp. AF33-1AC]
MKKKCWCGSQLVYDVCHEEFDKKLKYYKKHGYKVPTHKMIKNQKQVEAIKKAAVVNNGLLDYIEKNIKIGMTTQDIDDMAVAYTSSHGGYSADLNYQGYPKSICTSVNDEVCHGIPGNYVLKDGDIINVDATTGVNGYYADASRMFMLGHVSEEAKRLVKVTKECLEEGMKAVKPWKSCIGDIGAAIEKHAHLNGYSVVQEFCGHGIGSSMHEDPYVFHFKPNEKTELIVPGMVFTIEPMINQGTRHIHLGYDNDWTVYTDDGKLSAQWEHTFLVTEDGVEIISQ